jgi:hypothetical protein
MAPAAEPALGHSPPDVLEYMLSWLRASATGATFGQVPALWGLLPIALALSLFP